MYVIFTETTRPTDYTIKINNNNVQALNKMPREILPHYLTTLPNIYCTFVKKSIINNSKKYVNCDEFNFLFRLCLLPTLLFEATTLKSEISLIPIPQNRTHLPGYSTSMLASFLPLSCNVRVSCIPQV